ncbi:LysR family transcriptional regulator [Actinospica acidithermotolerans]|uniref:LysR family transcriptional regulator n=1 Tax=Actinospica acidithermotolerans TaxID=2828514 RepID=UPI0027DEA9C8|nr:LysR family transcriptional regulator [Actinospica acidithermotolerans]
MALSDLRAIAGRILANVNPADLSAWAPKDVLEAHFTTSPAGIHHRAQARPGFMAPPTAAITAIAVIATLRILGETRLAPAAKALRPLITTVRDGTEKTTASNIDTWGRGTGLVLRTVQLAALGPSLRPSDQLRFRTLATPSAPTNTSAEISRRACALPSELWPSWVVRLSPADGAYPRILAPALAASVLLVGSRLELNAASARLGEACDGLTVSRVLQLLQEKQCWEPVATALIRLANYLDNHGSPIDYRRRRRLDYADLLPPGQWKAICREAGYPPGGELRIRIARCVLFRRLSGMPLESAPEFPMAGVAAFRAEAERFAALRTPLLSQGLDYASETFLAQNGVHGEAVNWHPPTDLLDGLDLPGADPAAIDVERLHRLVCGRRNAVAAAAKVFGTSIEAVRLTLEEYPAPPAPPSARACAILLVRDAVSQKLAPDEFRRRYIDEHQSLRAIALDVGVSRNTVARLAIKHGIELREGPQDYKRRGVVERDWLFEQYVTRRRTLPEIAREKGMSTANMARWARTHGIPLRPRGGASHHNAMHGVDAAPEILWPLLHGEYALERLRRFAAVSAYDTLTAAAATLGTTQSALTSQITRLERDLGEPLLVRAERGSAMQLTETGHAVLAALHQLDDR